MLEVSKIERYLWQNRALLESRKDFGNRAYREVGRPYWEYQQIPIDRNKSNVSIAFAFVATHNHFVLDRGGKVFNRTAPIIKLPSNVTEDDYLALLGLLNSSAACFWLKAVCFCKGLGGQGGGIKPEEWHRAYEFEAAKLYQFPIPEMNFRLIRLCKLMDSLASKASQQTAGIICRERIDELRQRLSKARAAYEQLHRQMVSTQEEIDWLVYSIYGLCEYMPASDEALHNGLHPEDRPVEQLFKEQLTVRSFFERVR